MSAKFYVSEIVDGKKQPKVFNYGLRSGPGEPKRFSVRWPTDQEWADYRRGVKITRPIANQHALPGSNIPAKSVELMEKISVGEQPTYDPHEAAVIVGYLQRADDSECHEEEDGYRVTMTVAGGIHVSHMFKTPTFSAQEKYVQSAISIKAVGRIEETREFLEPAAELFDSLIVQSDGYDCPVPIVHKTKALSELLQRWRQSNEEIDPES